MINFKRAEMHFTVFWHNWVHFWSTNVHCTVKGHSQSLEVVRDKFYLSLKVEGGVLD